MLNKLFEQKFNLEAAEETSEVFETLSMATATSKEYLKNSNNESMVDELKNDLAEQEEEMSKMSSFFASAANEDESELLKELENLSLEEKPVAERERILAEMQREEAAALDQQLAEWDQKVNSTQNAASANAD